MLSMHSNANCVVPIGTFEMTYVNHYDKDDIFFIKGVRLEANYQKMQIKVLEDLKGNMPEKDTIMIWGDAPPCISACRVDGFWECNDTLCLIIRKTSLLEREFCPDEWEWGDYFEKWDDYYEVLQSTYSIVCFSEGYITGYIYSVYEKTTVLFADFLDGISGMADVSVNQNVYVYPNPACSQLFINSQNGYYPVKAQIYNSAGIPVTDVTSPTKPIIELDVSNLTSGFYILYLTDVNGKRLTLNFMKQ